MSSVAAGGPPPPFASGPPGAPPSSAVLAAASAAVAEAHAAGYAAGQASGQQGAAVPTQAEVSQVSGLGDASTVSASHDGPLGASLGEQTMTLEQTVRSLHTEGSERDLAHLLEVRPQTRPYVSFAQTLHAWRRSKNMALKI